jgi:hypothetical protein
MVTIVPQGLEKYALRLIPPLLDRADWRPLCGYLQFGVRRMLWACWIVGVAAGYPPGAPGGYVI